MNAILTFPTILAVELQQLRCEVACHCQAVNVESALFEQTCSMWGSYESDIARRMAVLRQRLAFLA